ncbi:MAG: MFS transporter [Alphaproteobacteria bacterium]
MAISRGRRNVIFLVLCQAFAMTGNSLVGVTSALVGHALLVDKAFATLPLGLQFLATMCSTIPASYLMRRIGRRAGFLIGAAVGALGASISATAILASSFAGFVAGSMITGVFFAFVLFFRFAAAEAADPAFQGKAISLVLGGGVAAAVFGPSLAQWSKDMFEPIVFAGCYVVLVLLCLATMATMSRIDIGRPGAAERDAAARPLRAIVRQPACWVAMLCGPISYGAMSLAMTATPLAMLACGFDFPDTAFVIQWHQLGMFAPSFVTGHLIARFGLLNVMAFGGVLLAGSAAVNLSGVAFLNFWSGLLLLGVGWNFLFVGSTTLLTRAYRPSEKAKVQGVNDFLVFGTITAAALSSGALQHLLGWNAVNLGTIPLAGTALAAIIWLRAQRVPVAA